MKKFINSLSNCRLHNKECVNVNCDLYSVCNQTPYEVMGKKKPDKLFLMANGGDTEYLLNRPFSGIPGMSVRYTLFKLGINDYAMANLCRVSVPNKGTRLSGNDYSMCIDHLTSFITKHKIRKIVLLGSIVIRNFFPDVTNTSSLYGTTRIKKIGGKNVECLLTINPATGIKNQDNLGILYNNLFNFFINPLPQITYKYAACSIDEKGEGVKFENITTLERVKQVLTKLYKSRKPLVFDIEATGLKKFSTDILTLQFYNGGKVGYNIPWLHPETPWSGKDLKKIIVMLKKFFSAGASYPFIVGHNLKYDYTMMDTCHGIHIEKRLWDTMCGMYLLDETKTKDDDADSSGGGMGGYGLGNAVQRYGFNDPWYFEAKENNANLVDQPLYDVAKYGVGDVVLNYGVFKCQIEEAKQQKYYRQFKNMQVHFYSHQIKLFADMEINGVLIDKEYLGVLTSPTQSPLLKYIDKLKEDFKSLEYVKQANARLCETQTSIFGDIWVFDLGKMEHKQLLFFDVMGLEPMSYGKAPKGKSKGLPSLDKTFQKEYKDLYDEVKIFALLQRANQLYNLYAKSFNEIFIKNPDCADGRIRPSFFGTRTRTGRGSSAKPNLQQTVRDDGSELVDIVRRLFISAPGNCIVKLDIMANEVRCWGSVSHDKNLHKTVIDGQVMRDAYFKEEPDEARFKQIKNDGDLHRGFASKFNTVEIADVTPDMRQASKNTTFGTMFGLTDKNLAISLGKSLDETKEIKRIFFKILKGGKKWIDNTEKEGREQLYVESMLGRRRRLWQHLLMFPLHKESTMTRPKLQMFNGLVRGVHASGDRRAVNSPIQGAGSDFSYFGTIAINWYNRRHNKGWKVMNVVHDSTESEIPVGDIEEYTIVAKVAYEMFIEQYLKRYYAIDLFVPVEIDIECGLSFVDMHKWDGNRKSLKLLAEKVVKLDKCRKAA